MSEPIYRDMKGQLLAVRDGVANIVTRYTVALGHENRLPIGTGVLVSHGDDLFVATVQHLTVGRNALNLDNLWCVPKPPFPVQIMEHRDERRRHLIRPDLGRTFGFRLRVTDTRTDAEADVALLRLVARPAEFHSMGFYPLEQARATALPHDRVVVCAFPSDLTMVHPVARVGAVFSRTLWGTLTTTDRENFDPTRQLLITYEGVGVIDAHGMSGGGVWAPSRPGEGLWNPGDHILVGLQIGYFETVPGRPFVATRIEEVLRLLA